MKRARLLLVLAAAACAPPALADAGRQAFAGFVVHPREGTGPSFEFSSSRATSDSPVVITVVGRKAKSSDRQFRTSLQKRWLRENVGEARELRMREQSMCGFRGPDGRCDRYEFEPGGEDNAYYFYLDNWK